MKKFIIGITALVLLAVGGNIAYYRYGIYLPMTWDTVSVWSKVEGREILVDRGNGFEPFEIRGVDLGAGIPGKYATELAIDKETYLRWFRLIQEMGANTIRVYTILGSDFYNAFYEYNKGNENPLYLIHGVWVNDYIQYSRLDAYDDQFFGAFREDCRVMVDVIHGRRDYYLGEGAGSGSYRKDISPWVLGYILGVEWEDVTVAYTDDKYPDRNHYAGRYLSTSPDATPFEAMLAQVGDETIAYETNRYGQQRLLAFSNWPTTDPFDYPSKVRKYFLKCAEVDVEHILSSGEFLSGQFASYHVYPYYPDYFSYYGDESQYLDGSGRVNTYYAYLKVLREHHTMPVVIAEYGVPSSRGMAQRDKHTGRNQGGMSEQEQGRAIVECYQDIRAAGCAGSIIFTWQDEWFKRTWNTMHAVDLQKTPYWSDYQTNEQYFGLLAFDPGEEQSVCYVDGDLSEWGPEDLAARSAPEAGTGELTLSMKYDEKFLYFLVRGEGIAEEPVYIPLDTTPKSGSYYCQNYSLRFDRQADFVVALDGRDNSRVVVQERYEVLRALFRPEVQNRDAFLEPLEPDSPFFRPIFLLLRNPYQIEDLKSTSDIYETGRLTYGNANPDSPYFNSLADFCWSPDGNGVEVKLPWQLLNFSCPASMTIHDDYYEHYGVEDLVIKEFYAGVSRGQSAGERVPLFPYAPSPWGRKVTYHERLKRSYYMVQEMWAE